MSVTLIRIADICTHGHMRQSFIYDLHHQGLIHIIRQQEEDYVDENELPHVERYYSWHEDLEINIHGIEAIQHLLTKIEHLQREIRRLKAESEPDRDDRQSLTHIP